MPLFGHLHWDKKNNWSNLITAGHVDKLKCTAWVAGKFLFVYLLCIELAKVCLLSIKSTEIVPKSFKYWVC